LRSGRLELLRSEQRKNTIVDFRANVCLANRIQDNSEISDDSRLDIREGDAEQKQCQECTCESHCVYPMRFYLDGSQSQMAWTIDRGMIVVRQDS
jgi:hypothetical protein